MKVTGPFFTRDNEGADMVGAIIPFFSDALFSRTHDDKKIEMATISKFKFEYDLINLASVILLMLLSTKKIVAEEFEVSRKIDIPEDGKSNL